MIQSLQVPTATLIGQNGKAIDHDVCVCVCVRARARVRACVCVCTCARSKLITISPYCNSNIRLVILSEKA